MKDPELFEYQDELVSLNLTALEIIHKLTLKCEEVFYEYT